MHQLKYRIKNLAPLVISARYGDNNMVSTEKYIPGTSVLGLLAARFFKKEKVASETACQNDSFRRFFLDGQLKFGNAFILSKDKDGDEYPHYPTPFSIQKEKRGEGIYDLLLLEEDEEPDKATKSVGKFCDLEDEDIRFKDVNTDLNFHHARDSKTGAPEDGVIFNYESVASGQEFEGAISGSTDDLNLLLKIYGTKSWMGYIGRSKNAQYGKIRFEIKDDTPHTVSYTGCNSTKIALTLLSDTIIYNANGFSCTDKDVMAQYLGVTVKKAFFRKGDTENFVGVWRLKKPSENCFLAGSSFLLEITDADRQTLEAFQKTGIGERTHEGFGQCIFNWQKEEELQEQPWEAPTLPKPATPIPTATRTILEMLVKKAIHKQIKLDAMEDLSTFETEAKKHKSVPLPSNSLIGRLGSMIASMNCQRFTETLMNDKKGKKLRKTAIKQLDRCRNKNVTLLNFLIKKTVPIKEVLKQTTLSDVRQLCEEIGLSIEKDKVFEEGLYRVYFSTFFSMMRKAKRREDKNEFKK
jgi:CRISPR-associated protein Csx10